MANTYSQINIHAVFAVAHRHALLHPSWRPELFAYMATVLKDITSYSLAVGGWHDHVHIFFEQKPAQTTSDVLRHLKAHSSKWINAKGVLAQRFEWQEGYGAFSYARSQRPQVIGYIMGQEAHHRTKTFREEYLQMLYDFEVAHDAQYLFEFFD